MFENLKTGFVVVAQAVLGTAMDSRPNGRVHGPNSNAQNLAAHQVQGEYFGTTAMGERLSAWIMAKVNNSLVLSCPCPRAV